MTIPTTTFDTWPDFCAYAETRNEGGTLYRGMSNANYKVKSTLELRLTSLGIPPEQWLAKEEASWSFFKGRAMSVLENVPSDGDRLGWLSLMRHYGAPTRMTDWTVSIWIASFFAFIGATGNENVAIWLLNADLCRRQFGFSEFEDYPWQPLAGVDGMSEARKSKYFDDENKLLQMCIDRNLEFPLPLTIPQPDERMRRQRACFVADGSLRGSFEQLASRGGELYFTEMHKISVAGRTFFGGMQPLHFDLAGTLVPSPPSRFVAKFELPGHLKMEALRFLMDKGISPETMFPGLDGIGRATDMAIEFNT